MTCQKPEEKEADETSLFSDDKRKKACLSKPSEHVAETGVEPVTSGL
jgi:hypothetical protein